MLSFSQTLVLSTTILVSSTVLYLLFSRQNTTPTFQIHGNHNPQKSNTQILRSCLYSEKKKRERKMKKEKKKKVQFAETVKEVKEMSEVAKKEKQRKPNKVSKTRNCIHEILVIPENRVALYKGILRDRVRRLECCC